MTDHTVKVWSGIRRAGGCIRPHHPDHGDASFTRRCIKERLNQTRTKPNHNLFSIWAHSLVSWCSWCCCHPMRWHNSCYMEQSEDRGCSVALQNSQLFYFALSFIYISLILLLWSSLSKPDPIPSPAPGYHNISQSEDVDTDDFHISLISSTNNLQCK